MSKSKKPTIGVLINQVNGRYQSLLRSGIEDYAKQQGLSFTYFIGKSLESPYLGENEHNSIYSVAEIQSLDGLIICAGTICSFLTPEKTTAFIHRFASQPIVTIGFEVAGIPCVTADTCTKLKELTAHLITEHEYRNIAFLSGPENNNESNLRKKAFLEALTEHNIKPDESLMLSGDFSYKSGVEAARKLATQKQQRFDVIICANDDMAFGFINTMKEYGFYAPQDYAITGIDDIPDAQFFHPPLTTINQSLYMQGYTAAEKIHNMILLGETTDQKRNPPPCKSGLRIRESCGCSATVKISARRIPATVRELQEENKLKISKEDLLQSLTSVLIPPPYNAQMNDAVVSLFDQITLDVRTLRSDSLFMRTLNEWLDITAESWRNFSNIWELILQQMQTTLLKGVKDIRLYAYIESLFARAMPLITGKVNKCNADYMQLVQNSMAAVNEYAPLFSSISTKKEFFSLTRTMLSIFNLPYLILYLSDGSCERIDTDVPNHDTSVIAMPIIIRHQSQNRFSGYVVIPDILNEPLIYELIRELLTWGVKSLTGKNTTAHRIEPETVAEYADTVPLSIIETDEKLNILSLNTNAARFFSGVTSLTSYIQSSNLETVIKSALSGQVISLPDVSLVFKENTLPVLRIMYAGMRLRWFFLDINKTARSAVLPCTNFFKEHNITDREQELIMYLLQGMRLREIAEKMFIAESTVKGHLSRIYEKCDVRGSTELRNLIQENIPNASGKNIYAYSLLAQLLQNKY